MDFRTCRKQVTKYSGFRLWSRFVCRIIGKEGHNVMGVDFSKSSIEDDREEEDSKKLEIEENTFDFVILINTDFGVLYPN